MFLTQLYLRSYITIVYSKKRKVSQICK